MKKILLLAIIVSIFLIAFVAFGHFSFVNHSIEENMPAYGRWGLFQPPHIVDNKSSETLSNLMSLQYLQGYNHAPKEINVTIYNKDLAFKGFNLYASAHAPEAFLMDMEGRILHKWHFDMKNIWPDDTKNLKSNYWRRLHLFENGDLLILYNCVGIIKIDKNSRLLWSYHDICHHDFSFDAKGNIYLLTAADHIYKNRIFSDNAITILLPNGKLKKKIYLFNLLSKSSLIKAEEIFNTADTTARLPYARMKELLFFADDIFHANSIQVLDGKLSSKFPYFKKGNVLISLRNIGILCLVDVDNENVAWLLKPTLWTMGQHDSILLSNGNILLFDNLFSMKKPYQSRVLEFEPLTQKIQWEYTGDNKNRFFSIISGKNQRLPNGNTLIVESCNGRAFEVTADKKIVWEFINPYRAGKNNELIATLHELVRLKSDFPLAWLKKNNTVFPKD